MRYSPHWASKNYRLPLRVIIAWAILLFLPNLLSAGEEQKIEVWLISTRCAPVCNAWEQARERIEYWRLDEKRQWIAADQASFAEGESKDTPFIFMLHGNRTTNDEAVEFAWPVYSWLKQHAERQSYRIVIWSWPSDRICRHIRPDVQTKASYCISQSYYLANCLRTMKSETPVSLIGYSFGSRIIAGSLQLLGGGTLEGHSLPPSPATTQNSIGKKIRAAFIAGAIDSFALAPGQIYEKAFSQVEEMLVTRNRCDKALRFYPRIYGRGGPEALGFVGPSCVCPGNIHLFEATYCVGKSHEWEDYIYCPTLFSVLPHYMFVDEK